MKTRNAEAQRLEGQYLAQLRVALAAHSNSEAAEILQGVRDHIDEALEETAGDEVTAVQMGNVLERLGPPEAFAQEDDSSERAGPATAAAQTSVAPPMVMTPPRVSKLAVASALSLPTAVLLGALVTVLGSGGRVASDSAVMLGMAVGATVLFTGAGIGVAALMAIRKSSGQLRGRGLAIMGIAELGLAVLWCVAAFCIYAALP